MAMVPAMTMFDFEKVKVNGIITPKDGTVRNNLSVDVSLGNDILETTTTDSNGKYNLEFFIPSGSYIYVPVIRCGNNKRTVFDVVQDSSSQTILQVVETNLTITSTKNILSFQDNDTATIDATLTYGTIPQPIEGEEISFVVKDSQNNIIDTQVSTTDSNGVASIVYESQGIGDVTISASVGGFVSKTYDIQDMIKYDDATSDKSSRYIATNTALSFDTDHYVAVSSTTNQSSNYMAFVEPKDMPSLSDFIIECDIKFVSGTGQGGLNYIDAITTASASQKAIELISAFNNNQKGIILRPWDVSHRVTGSLSTNTWYKFKLEIQGTTVTGTISQNGSNVYSQSFTWSTVSELAHMCIYQADVSNTIHWKNLKIKPL